MLAKLSEDILEFMLSCSDTPARISFDFYDDIDEIAKALSSDRETILIEIEDLEKNGFIKYEQYNGRQSGFYLSHKGLHKKEFDKRAKMDFVKKSILTPIFVAFVTSIITTSLWPSLLNWLQAMLLWILQSP